MPFPVKLLPILVMKIPQFLCSSPNCCEHDSLMNEAGDLPSSNARNSLSTPPLYSTKTTAVYNTTMILLVDDISCNIHKIIIANRKTISNTEYKFRTPKINLKHQKSLKIYFTH